jgi:hypothetical protein
MDVAYTPAHGGGLEYTCERSVGGRGHVRLSRGWGLESVSAHNQTISIRYQLYVDMAGNGTTCRSLSYMYNLV